MNAEVIWVAYAIDGIITEIKDFKNLDNNLSFELKFDKNTSKKVLIYINGKAINGFKLR